MGPIAFPDYMTPMQVNAAATRLYQNANAGEKQPPVKNWTDQAVYGRKPETVSDGPDAEPSTLNKVNQMLEPLANPKTASDFAGLLIPSGLGAPLAKMGAAAAETAGKYGDAIWELGKSFLPKKATDAIKVLSELNPSEWHSPLTVAGREARAHEAVAGIVDRYLPNTGGASAVANPAPADAAIGYATPTASAPPKIAISATDYKRIKDLVGQGLSQGEAVQTVMNLKVKGILPAANTPTMDAMQSLMK